MRKNWSNHFSITLVPLHQSNLLQQNPPPILLTNKNEKKNQHKSNHSIVLKASSLMGVCIHDTISMSVPCHKMPMEHSVCSANGNNSNAVCFPYQAECLFLSWNLPYVCWSFLSLFFVQPVRAWKSAVKKLCTDYGCFWFQLLLLVICCSMYLWCCDCCCSCCFCCCCYSCCCCCSTKLFKSIDYFMTRQSFCDRWWKMIALANSTFFQFASDAHWLAFNWTEQQQQSGIEWKYRSYELHSCIRVLLMLYIRNLICGCFANLARAIFHIILY